MHYRNPTDTKPTYLFGEAPAKNVEPSNGKKKRSNTKIEELITRNEVRRATTVQKLQSQDNVTVLSIDPPASNATTGDRPLYLPVKKSVQQSPPPITPILSPPPAFQDSKNRNKAKVGGHQLAVHQPGTRNDEKITGKGMVFSRSFEYDSRNKTDYKETLTSKSFDYDLQPPKTTQPVSQNSLTVRNFMRRDKSPVFSTLTGISPSYLTKRPTPDKSPIFPKAIPGNSVNNNFTSKLVSNNGSSGQQVQILGQYKSLDVEGVARSRRGQFTRTQTSGGAGPMSGFRNFGDNTTGINQRLNSCDSGARSGKTKS